MKNLSGLFGKIFLTLILTLGLASNGLADSNTKEKKTVEIKTEEATSVAAQPTPVVIEEDEEEMVIPSSGATQAVEEDTEVSTSEDF